MADKNNTNKSRSKIAIGVILGFVVFAAVVFGAVFAGGQIGLFMVGGVIIIFGIIALIGASSSKSKANKERTEQKRIAKEKTEQESLAEAYGLKAKAEAKEKAVAEKRAKEVAEENCAAKEKEEQKKKAAREASADSEQMVCSNCGKPMHKDATFCMFCGAKIQVVSDITDKEQIIREKPEQMVCSNCGKPMHKGAAFCMFCGAKSQNIPGNAGKTDKSENADEIIFEEGKCPACGNKIEDVDSVCRKCGFPVVSVNMNDNQQETDKIKEAVIKYRKTFSL